MANEKNQHSHACDIIQFPKREIIRCLWCDGVGTYRVISPGRVHIEVCRYCEGRGTVPKVVEQILKDMEQ